MDIQHYVDILERRKWVVLLTALVTVYIAGLGSYLVTPIYSASTMVRIAQIQDGVIDYADLNYSARLVNTYAHVLRSRPFLEEVIQRLDANASQQDPDLRPEDLARKIEVEVLAETELLRITAESTSPTQAMEIANMLATLLIEQGQRVYAGQGKTAREILGEQLVIVEESLARDRARRQSLYADNSGQVEAGTIQGLSAKIQIQEQTYAMLLNQYEEARVAEAMRANSISVVESAIVPKTPSRPRIMLNIALGFLVGLIGGMGLAFFFENLDPGGVLCGSVRGHTRSTVMGLHSSLQHCRKVSTSRLPSRWF